MCHLFKRSKLGRSIWFWTFEYLPAFEVFLYSHPSFVKIIAERLGVRRGTQTNLRLVHWYMMGNFPRGVFAISVSSILVSTTELMKLDHLTRPYEISAGLSRIRMDLIKSQPTEARRAFFSSDSVGWSYLGNFSWLYVELGWEICSAHVSTMIPWQAPLINCGILQTLVTTVFQVATDARSQWACKVKPVFHVCSRISAELHSWVTEVTGEPHWAGCLSFLNKEILLG